MKAITPRITRQFRFTPYKLPILSTREKELETVLEGIIQPVSLDDIEEQYSSWCKIRDETSQTPISYHSENSSFTTTVNDLFEIFQTNLNTIITLMENYISNPLNTDNELHSPITIRLATIKTLNDEFNTYKRSYMNDVQERQFDSYSTLSEENDLYEGEITRNVNIWFHKILDVLIENQTYIDHIQYTISRRKIQFIHIPENTTDTKHTLIVCFVVHGTHGSGYPTLLAVPYGKNVCKTTLALPGDPAFNSPSQLNDILSNYYRTYNNSDVIHKLQDDFVGSFTQISQHLKYPILQEITNRLQPVNNKSSDYLQLKYKTWCDSIRNSTSLLMFQTRYNEYIKNKTYGIKNGDNNRDINNIYVLLDTSGRFRPGEQLINYDETFRSSRKKGVSASITLQEFLNIFYGNGWDNIGIIDNTCESGNLPISHTTSFPDSITHNGLPNFRGGSRKKLTKFKNKKSKRAKRVSFIRKTRRK
jgi:hypothetical protein